MAVKDKKLSERPGSCSDCLLIKINLLKSSSQKSKGRNLHGVFSPVVIDVANIILFPCNSRVIQVATLTNLGQYNSIKQKVTPL